MAANRLEHPKSVDAVLELGSIGTGRGLLWLLSELVLEGLAADGV